MKTIKTFENFINENKSQSKFSPNLFYIVGKMKNGKYDFWKKGFKNKSGSEEGYNIEDIKQSFEEQGYTDVKVITGNMLALMIAYGETGGYEGV